MDQMMNFSRRRSQTVNTLGQFHLHLELQMMTNLKSFFRDRQIDVTDIIETVKAEKRMSGRGDRSNENTVGAYWELVQLIFTAFHLDQSQNTFCASYFTTNQQSNILNYKVALDIVQVVLNKCEIASGKLEDDISPAITPTRGSIDYLNRSSISS